MRNNQRNLVDKIMINQIGTKININLNTKNIFESGAYYSYAGQSLNTSNHRLDEDSQVQQGLCII